MEDICSHSVSRNISYIIFTLDNIQIKNIKYNRLLYYTKYIGLKKVDLIQVYPRFALSIMTRKLMQFPEIFTHKLSPTNTTFSTLIPTVGIL